LPNFDFVTVMQILRALYYQRVAGGEARQHSYICAAVHAKTDGAALDSSIANQ
jgi:hypothetical protein